MDDLPAKASILLVDDHWANLAALEAILAPLGHRLVLARSGQAALRALLVEDFAAVLLDVQMPGMNGFETARAIKTRERSRHVPIVFLTAMEAGRSLLDKGYGEGAVDFILKPFETGILRAKVQVFVDLYLRTLQVQRLEAQLRQSQIALLEQRRAEEQLRQQQALDASEQRFLSVVSALSEGVILQDETGAVRFANASARAMLGGLEIDRHPALGHPGSPTAAMVDEHGEPLECEQLPSLVALRNGRPELNRTVGLRQPDGQVRWLTMNAQPLFADGDRTTGVVTSFFDVTHQLRNEARLRLLAQADAVLVGSLDPDHTLSEVAKLITPVLGHYCFADAVLADGTRRRVAAVSALAGRESIIEELRVRPIVDHPAAPHPAAIAIREQRTVVGRVHSLEDLRTLAEDERHFALISSLDVRAYAAIPLRARERTLGVLTLCLGPSRKEFSPAELATAEDLARRTALAIDNARLYREAQEAVRLRDEFLSVASHELKTPLTPLQLKLTALTRDAEREAPILPRRLCSDLDVARRQVRKLSDLIGDLLDVSRISAGRLQLNRERVDLADLVGDVVTRFAPQAEKACCPIALDLPREPVHGEWDRMRVEQAVTNLLSNAIKYGAGRPVQMALSCRDGRARLEVRDRGIGIAPDHLGRIFGRYERAVSDRHYGGLGLGLYITAQIVEALGGSVAVQSELNEGSTFSFELPLLPAREQPSSSNQLRIPTGGATPL